MRGKIKPNKAAFYLNARGEFTNLIIEKKVGWTEMRVNNVSICKLFIENQECRLWLINMTDEWYEWWTESKRINLVPNDCYRGQFLPKDTIKMKYPMN